MLEYWISNTDSDPFSPDCKKISPKLVANWKGPLATGSRIAAAASNLFWYKNTLPNNACAANFVTLPFCVLTAGKTLMALFRSSSICLYTSALGALVNFLESEAVSLFSTNKGTSPNILTNSK